MTEGIKLLVEEKILSPLERRLGSELAGDHILEVELAKVTNHHEEGKIWKCETNIALPHIKRTLYAKSLSESLEAAIDETKDEIEREATDFKNKRLAKFLKMARQLKDRSHITRLAQFPSYATKRASELYRWIRRRK